MTNNTLKPHPKLIPFNFMKWVDDNADSFKPPVGNKLLHQDANMIVMVVGGPNTRVDFHDDPVEEWFYQIKGDMVLKIYDNGEIYDVVVREGEVFMLPPHTIHAPQRPQENSLGIVVEGARPEGATEGFNWYCFNCKELVHRIEVSLEGAEGIVKQLPPLYEAFHNDMNARTCKNCGEIHPGKGKPPEGWVTL